MTGDVFECCDDYVLTCILGYANVQAVSGPGDDSAATNDTSSDGTSITTSGPDSNVEPESVILADCPSELQSDATAISLGIR